MSPSIFLIDGGGQLTRLDRSDYESESLLQKLLAEHPSLLGITDADDQQLLLIKREQAVPDSEGGAGRWSLDHLFIARNAVPVLVEVKRASDTRARREVVAQLLDYAANGVAYWPLQHLIEAFRRTAEESGRDADALLSAFLGDDADPESFWRQVEANLRSGRIRMVFVADSIPGDLRRIVEFLNEQMRQAEVLAVEVEQYVAQDGMRTLVPRLLGATERARSNKAITGTSERLTIDEWLGRLADRHGAEAREGAERAIAWIRQQDCPIALTKTQDALSVRVPTEDGRTAWPFFIRTTGRFEISLQYLKSRPAFTSDDARRKLLDRVRALPGVIIATQKLTGWPAFPVSELVRDEFWAQFIEVADEVVDRARQSAPESSEAG